jgi:hypothetical protein
VRRRLALLLLLLAVPAGASARGGAVLTVTQGADGVPNSLRDLVGKAKPGDTIRFASPLRVELRRPLVLATPRLRIESEGQKAEILGVRTGDRAFIRVTADSVTLANLKLTDVAVSFEGRAPNGPAGARVLDVEASLPGKWARRAALAFDFADDVRIVGGRVQGGIELQSVEGAVVQGVTLAGPGSVLGDDQGRRIRLERNTVESGRVTLRSQGVTVAGNTLKPGTTLDVWVVEGGSGSVERNVLDGARLVAQAGGRLSVAGNRLAGTWRRGAGPAGLVLGCASDGIAPNLEARGNTVTGWRIGMQVACAKERGRVVLGPNTIERNGIGLVVQSGDVRVSGTTVRHNLAAGIHVSSSAARPVLTRLATGGNGGLGIVRVFEPRRPKLEYDRKRHRIRGLACPNCVVELYEAEEGDEPGEGLRYLATVRAADNGSFVYPAKGELDCPRTGRVTATATDSKQRRTSEFAADAECGCVISADFVVRGAPPTGFAQFGLTAVFPEGYRVREVTLTDPETEKIPPAGALGPLLQWEEVQNPARAAGAEHDFFVRVTYRDPTGPVAAPVRKIWHYRVQYDPPRGQTACRGRLVAIWEPVR